MCSHEYRNIEPWPADKTKRSRLSQDGSSGLYDLRTDTRLLSTWAIWWARGYILGEAYISCPKSTAPISAQPSGRPMWPDEAFLMESMASPRDSSAA